MLELNPTYIFLPELNLNPVNFFLFLTLFVKAGNCQLCHEFVFGTWSDPPITSLYSCDRKHELSLCYLILNKCYISHPLFKSELRYYFINA